MVLRQGASSLSDLNGSARGKPMSDTVIIHEWLTNFAGSERVVDSLRRCFPGAPVLTSMKWGQPFDTWDVQTSFLQRAANGPRSHARVLPLMPLAMRSLPIPPARLAVTCFHTFALHARVPEGTPHLVYCCTPPRFLWRRDQVAEGGGPLLRAGTRLLGAPLRRLDLNRARRDLQFVALSRAVASRIASTYDHLAPVVHPPVDVDRFAAHRHLPRGENFLFVSRLVPYKRADLAVDTFTELGWPLVVAGDGPARAALERRAGKNVKFLGHVPDADLPSLIASSRGLVFPADEDFGIVAVEAIAAGTPVVALRAGGSLDTVTEDQSGVFFDEHSVASLRGAVERLAARDWNPDEVSACATPFAEHRFIREIRELADHLLAGARV